jgi:hypothetical protein
MTTLHDDFLQKMTALALRWSRIGVTTVVACRGTGTVGSFFG